VSLGRIHQLSPALVNRIAAGEVIERPASVVKELVENSIDAGATQIVVEIEDGGLSLIQIIDDGGGIPVEDLPLAFASHATSKLTSDEDLFAISTMGFRGEALASIGSVSHARILSRTPGSQAAYEIYNRGSVISDAQAAAGNLGTTVEIRNLFFNTPARRKFLRGPSTEYGHIADAVIRLALPHPQIAFKLLHNGRVTEDLPATNSAEERLLCAWPEEFREQRLPLDVRDAEIRISGLIGLPELAKPTAKHQYFYLNGRFIRDKFVQHALRESYRGLTEPGRQPAAILLIQIPAQDVDVNVHPTKAEVRFKDSGRIHGLVLSSIREKLLGSDLTPSATPRAEFQIAPDTFRQDMQTRLAAFFKGQSPTPQENSDSTSPGSGGSHPAPFALSQQSSYAPLPFTEAVEGKNRDGNRDRDGFSSASTNSNGPALTPLPAIQLHNSYLVAESDDGMIIIDQHALHERIMYEDLRTRLARGPLESQRLLIPATLPASARQMDLLDQIQPLLLKLGIELSAIAPNALAIHAFPSFLEKLDPAGFIGELLERGEQELLDLHDEELLHEVLDMMACKAAVKAGDPLSPQEIAALLARRDLVERSSNCPHGRPTTLRLSLRDLEKQFKRTGF
jgi:DNA mismatch repair protein MutL